MEATNLFLNILSSSYHRRIHVHLTSRTSRLYFENPPIFDGLASELILQHQLSIPEIVLFPYLWIAVATQIFWIAQLTNIVVRMLKKRIKKLIYFKNCEFGYFNQF